MASISSVSVLVVEDDPDSGELLGFYLESQGARVRVVDRADAARAALAEATADVVMTDVSLPGEDGFSLVASLRANPATARIPAIAVTGRTDEASRKRAIEAGFQKFLSKPLDLFSLSTAIASVVTTAGPAPANETDEARVARLVASRDIRALLAFLNAATPYRYTSILRFDDGKLESIWSFDREADGVDGFPADTPREASYCSFIQESRTPFAMVDARLEPRAANHPARDALRAYCGVPILHADGHVLATLCHYDPDPHVVDAAAVASLERVAAWLGPALSDRRELLRTA